MSANHDPHTRWEVTHYGTSMHPQVDTYEDCAEAWAHWDRIKDDPMAGAHSIERVTTLATKEHH